MTDLVAVFLDARGEGIAGPEREMLGLAIETELAAAHEAWPTVAVDAADWVAAIAAIAPRPLDPQRPFGTLVATDHYLAFACGRGDPRAVAACDAMLVREAGFAADGTRMHASVRDEATQVSREHLLSPRANKPPAILSYAGRGPLRAWLRVTVSRELVRIAKAQQRSVPLEEHLVASPVVAGDPVLEELKTKYRAELADAFRIALGELPARERTLLRYQLVDNLTIDDLGTLFKVHRATAARWIAKIREDLVDRTRAQMAATLGLDTEEVASIVRLVQSQLEVSVIRHLEPPDHEPGG